MEAIQQEGIQPDKVMFLSALKACEYTGSLLLGKVLHAQIIRSGLETDVFVGNTLIDMYAKCGGLQEAREVFDQLQNRSVVSWGAMITAYANYGHGFLALELLERMQYGDVQPNEVIFLNILKACGSIKAIEQGKLVHHQIIKSGMELDDEICSTLIDMYAKSGSLEEARNVFDMLPNRNMVSWGAMIAGYAQRGHGFAAYQLFQQMQQQGVKPAIVTYLCVLKAVDSINFQWQGKHIHDEIIQNGFESDEAIGNTLVDMYAKCGSMEDARNVFDDLQNPSMVSWSALMGGFVQHGHGLLALELFAKMQQDGVKPDKVAHLCVLKACASMGALMQGKLIHNEVIGSEYEGHVVVGNALIDMYAKCWCLEEACKVFDGLASRDLVTWGAMIAGYAQQGNCRLAKICLEAMQQQGLKPNNVIFTSLLSACCQAGEVKEGDLYFKTMEDHGISPTVEHVTCMVDLLGGAGHLKEAEQLIQIMSTQCDITGYMSLLTACRTYVNVELGRQCFDKIVLLDPDIASGYVLMASIYAAANMWESAHNIDEMRNNASAQKVPGRACIEVKGTVLEFVVGEKAYSWSDYHVDSDKFLRIMKKEGYVPQLNLMT